MAKNKTPKFLEKMVAKIEEYNKIYIFGHVRPDGDCYGSQFGLKNLLLENYPGKDVHVIGQEAQYVAFLGTPESIEATPDEAFKGALAICVDCGAADRLSEPRYELCDYVIKIDHHIADKHYGNIWFVEEETPACCQIITEMAMKLKWKINAEAAFALYTGLVTDTGRFRFRGVDDKTFKAAGELMKHNVDIEKLDGFLSVDTMNVIHLKGYVLSNAEFTPNGCVYVKMTRDVIEKYGVSDEEAAAQVSLIGTIENYPVWFFFIEYPGEIRIRLRSRGPLVDKLANNYGGGGHSKAAGAKLTSWDELPKFLAEADDLVRRFKENGDLY